MSGGQPRQECVLNYPHLEFAHQLRMLAPLLLVPVYKCCRKLQTVARGSIQKGLSIVSDWHGGSFKWPQGKHARHLSIARPYISIVVNARHSGLGNRFTALPKPAGGKLERILEVASSTSRRDRPHSARTAVTIVAAFALNALHG